ncbi:sulfatase-like hydrolase/transferase [Rhodohalobacter sulfatireducens]|uniref:Sulfatase-like hydrolase/transferase n=1 Tax=Rhodohalobacter sulfatireducens TaxID=2911366 RepID=A0ABS9KGW2_9BACT|nr:sulfatase-like hydrolase/transferase [Rhodohalobacter sulfatireducens]MCG2590093.1 sulfatase-like hydrolase/transferase [Rhodohalobacter sulfatireducens]
MKFIKTISLASIVFLFSLGYCFGQQGERQAEQPNIIFMFIDDMGYADLSSYGNREMETPNIDRLADEGIKFTNGYVAYPICSPARVSVMTGQFPAKWNIHSFLASRERNQRRGIANYLDPKAPSIARAMQEAGYATAHFGKWHMGGGRDVDDAPIPTEYGFDQSLVSFEGLGDRLLRNDGHDLSEANAKLGQGQIQWVEKWKRSGIYADSTISFIERHKNQPFYIHFWPGDVHDPFIPNPEWLDRFSEFDNHHYKRDFYATLWNLDNQVGRILDKLDELGLAENTLVILMSDNGPTDWPYYYEEFYWPPGSVDPFRGRKWGLYEGGIRVPFLARWPAKIPEGKVDSTTMINSMDLFPTLANFSGISSSDMKFDGLDMSSALLGNPKQRGEPMFWEYGREDFYLFPANPRFRSPNLAVRHGDWKLLVNDDGTEPELYNLKRDHAETMNVKDEYPDITERLLEEVLEWRRSIP